LLCSHIFLFNATPTTQTYTLSLHDALPISCFHADSLSARKGPFAWAGSQCSPCDITLIAHRQKKSIYRGVKPGRDMGKEAGSGKDRKSTRLNSSHVKISYAVFCLKKKKQQP